jgi:hypothetical protein
MLSGRRGQPRPLQRRLLGKPVACRRRKKRQPSARRYGTTLKPSRCAGSARGCRDSAHSTRLFIPLRGQAINSGILAELADARRIGQDAARRSEALLREREGLRAQLSSLQESFKAGENEAAGVIGGHAARIAALQVSISGTRAAPSLIVHVIGADALFLALTTNFLSFLQGEVAAAAAEAAAALSDAASSRAEATAVAALAREAETERDRSRHAAEKLRAEILQTQAALTEAREAASAARDAAAASEARAATAAAAAEAARSEAAETAAKFSSSNASTEATIREATSRAQVGWGAGRRSKMLLARVISPLLTCCRFAAC